MKVTINEPESKNQCVKYPRLLTHTHTGQVVYATDEHAGVWIHGTNAGMLAPKAGGTWRDSGWTPWAGAITLSND